jgi:hypothetical protein
MNRRRTFGNASLLRPLIALVPAVALLNGCPTVIGPKGVAAAPEGQPQLGNNASLAGKRPFPADNPWNRDISKDPVDPNSDALIAAIGSQKPLHPDFGTVYEGKPMGIPYVVVAGNQPKVPVRFEYADECDPGPYPVPPNPPVEGGSDRHILMVDRDNWKLYELFAAERDGQGWKAGSGAIFDLNTGKDRPAGWTSADAAGLPIFPGLVRYDEVMELGAIRHALRFTVRQSRRAYVHPARHWASSKKDPSLPPMGMRVRLKAGYDISRHPKSAQVILTALKTYGMLLADNGSDWFLSGSPHPKWPDEELNTLKRVRGSDFEVVRIDRIVHD